ncbi:MAG: type II secretion system protein [Nitrospiraceae bacterium]|nr:type II secretion system protein [Nitrospiraceae bacterium]
MNSGARRGGFTLLEVLIAMAVLSIALVAVFELFSSGLRGLSASDEYVIAAVKAEAKMREVLDEEKLEEKSWQETSDDGYRFDVAIKKTDAERTEMLPVDLMEVSLTVSWTRGVKERSLSLKTLKMVNKKI